MNAQYQLKIKELRHVNGLTQKQVAEVLGTSQTMYARYEKSVCEMPIKHLIKLAQHYNVSCDYLLGLTEQK